MPDAEIVARSGDGRAIVRRRRRHYVAGLYEVLGPAEGAVLLAAEIDVMTGMRP